MNSKVINITALIVERNITDVLADAPVYPHRMAFSIPYYRQKLLAYVLNGVHNRYILFEEGSSGQMLVALCHFLQEQARIEALIQEGLVMILEDHHDWIHHFIYGVNRLL